MNDIEDALRGWAREQTDHAPHVHVDPDLFDGHRRRAWLAPLAAAAAVLVIAGGVLAVRPWQTGSPQAAHRSATNGIRTNTHGKAPAGDRETVFHGLALYVPKSWPDNALGCGDNPLKDTVITTVGAVATCASGIPAGTTWVQWQTDAGYHVPISSGRNTQIRIGTLTGTRTIGRLGSLHVIRVRVPKAAAVVTITSPSARRATELAATLHTVTHDQHGCQARIGTEIDLSHFAVATGDSSHDLRRLVPDRPTKITVCRFENGWLEYSGVAGGPKASAAAALINRLPSGFSRAAPRSAVGLECSLESDPGGQDELFEVTATYPDRTIVGLLARLGLCGSLGITNGVSHGQRSTQLVQFLTRYAGSTGVIPVDVTPAQ